MGIALTIIGALVFIVGIVLFVKGLLKESGKRVAGAILVYVIGCASLGVGVVMWIHAIEDDTVGIVPDLIRIGLLLNI